MVWVGAASGDGTTLDYFYDNGLIPDLLIVDQACGAQKSAEARGIPVYKLPRRGKFAEGKLTPERVQYTLEVRSFLQDCGADWLMMAGWMTVFSPEMFEIFANKVLNLHPSLFRNGTAIFPGNYDVAVQAAIDAYHRGEITVTGSTVHVATGEVDTGFALGHSDVEIMPDDDVASLHGRMKDKEKPLYLRVVKTLLST